MQRYTMQDPYYLHIECHFCTLNCHVFLIYFILYPEFSEAEFSSLAAVYFSEWFFVFLFKGYKGYKDACPKLQVLGASSF